MRCFVVSVATHESSKKTNPKPPLWIIIQNFQWSYICDTELQILGSTTNQFFLKMELFLPQASGAFEGRHSQGKSLQILYQAMKQQRRHRLEDPDLTYTLMNGPRSQRKAGKQKQSLQAVQRARASILDSQGQPKSSWCCKRLWSYSRIQA